MESIQSPFCPRSTMLVSPLVTAGTTLFLYQPEVMTEQHRTEYLTSGRLYEICVNSHTVSIYTSTHEAYKEALDYLSRLYSVYTDHDNDCVLWEL